MRNLALSFLCLIAGACASGTGTGAGSAKLFHDGRIYLGEPEWRRVDALLVRDGRVVAAGSVDELAAQAGGAERIDLHGASAYPGLPGRARPPRESRPLAGDRRPARRDVVRGGRAPHGGAARASCRPARG
jgi:hypothetical protein